MNVVVVGAGQAGCSAAATLRAGGLDGRIVVVGDEPHLPYQRPPLSKSFIAGEGVELRALELRDEKYYQTHGIELKCGTRVDAIDRETATVVLDGGEILGWDRLVLATGSRARKLRLPGGGAVSGLRSIADAVVLRERMRTARSVSVVGGGALGLELAAASAADGLQVTVVDVAPRLLGRLVTPRFAERLRGLHVERGIDVHLGVTVTGFQTEESGGGRIVLADGRVFHGDVVVAAVGGEPRTRLAVQCGLAVDDHGIAVDEQLRTSDPRILAAGDCSSFPASDGSGQIRLESVQNAVDQGTFVGRQILGASDERYTPLPWFWSDQAGLKIQVAGVVAATDEVVALPGGQNDKFTHLVFRNGCLVAVETLNRPADHLAARRLLGSGSVVTADALRKVEPLSMGALVAHRESRTKSERTDREVRSAS